MKRLSSVRPRAAALLSILGGAAVALLASPAHAQTVACGCSTSTGALAACLDDFRALPPDPLIGARIVDDIFETTDHHDARALTFARYFRGLAPSTPGGPPSPLAGCIGSSNAIAPPFTTCAACNCAACSPTVCTNYVCTGAYDHTSDVTIHEAADQLDWRWWQLARGSWESAWAGGAPDVGTSPPGARDCIDLNDVAHCSYNPVYGLIYDLGGEANRAAIFPITDHTTDSCLEAIEWSVWLTDNPESTSVVRDGEPPDPRRWNRARLDQIFLQGWTRNPRSLGNPSDTSYLRDVTAGDAQSDSPTVVFSLPCGVTFRYASVLSGNFGNPGPHCEFNSSDDEIDAVAGLNADNTRICPDLDGDGHRDAACGGDDCNDADPNVHPGAVETCAGTRDLNCDGALTYCPATTTCIGGFCASHCVEGSCAQDFVCVSVAGSDGCVPGACAGVTCPVGEVCGPAGCQDPCLGAVCPAGETCRGGDCVNPCSGLACPTQQHCEAGACVPDCGCYTCASHPGLVCESSGTHCVSPDCETTSCAPGSVRDCTGAAAVCRVLCAGVRCPIGEACNTTDGRCHRDLCFGVACAGGFSCEMGVCVAPPMPDAGHPDSSAIDSGSTPQDAGDVRADGAATDGRMDAGLGDGGTGATRSSCGCRVPATRSAPTLTGIGVALAAMLARRRRARRSGARSPS
ncbi:MAG: putative metal-binding motif-containing protein [Deltaproteobacteria bacterium]